MIHAPYFYAFIEATVYLGFVAATLVLYSAAMHVTRLMIEAKREDRHELLNWMTEHRLSLVWYPPADTWQVVQQVERVPGDPTWHRSFGVWGEYMLVPVASGKRWELAVQAARDWQVVADAYPEIRATSGFPRQAPTEPGRGGWVK